MKPRKSKTKQQTNVELSHAVMVQQLVKSPHLIVLEQRVDRVNFIHMAIGIASEGGEILDVAKKLFAYNQDIESHRENVIEELGDLEFYMCGLRKALGITREETLTHNINKLGQRYIGHNYSDRQAKERNDKKKVT